MLRQGSFIICTNKVFRNDEIFLIGELKTPNIYDELAGLDFFGLFKLVKKSGYLTWQYFGNLSRSRGEYFPQIINELENEKFLLFPERYMFDTWRNLLDDFAVQSLNRSSKFEHETSFFFNLLESFEPNQNWTRSQIETPLNITELKESNTMMQLFIV